MSNQVVEKGVELPTLEGGPKAAPDAVVSRTTVLNESNAQISGSELQILRRLNTYNTSSTNTAAMQLQDFVDQNFQLIKDNADRLHEEELISTQIWKMLQNQNISAIAQQEIANQVASKLHTVGENKDISPQQLIKLIESLDTKADLVQGQAATEKKIQQAITRVHETLTEVDAHSPSSSSAVAIKAASERIKDYLAIQSGATEEQALHRLAQALQVKNPPISPSTLHLVFDGSRQQTPSNIQENISRAGQREGLLVDYSTISNNQRASLLEEIHVAAAKQARSDIDKSPHATLNPRTADITLHAIRQHHPEIQSSTEFNQSALKTFQASYNQEVAQLKQTSEQQKAKLSFVEQWSENFSQMGSFFYRTAASVTTFVSSLPEKATQIKEKVFQISEKVGETVSSIASNVWSLSQKAASFLSDPQTWITAYEAITNPSTWTSVLEFTKKAAVATWNAITSPENWYTVGKALWTGIKAAGEFAYNIVTDPQKAWEALKTVGGFLYDMGKSLGINDMLWGAVKFVEGTVRFGLAQFQFGYSLLTNGAKLLTGQCSFDSFTQNLSKDWDSSYGKALSCFVESTAAVKGAVLAFGEISGITDVIMAGYYLSTGNYAMAAMHAGFALLSWGSIAATIATAGAGAGAIAGVVTLKLTISQAIKQFGKAALKSIAKEGFEQLAKETGETIVGQITKEMGDQFSKQVIATADKIVQEGVGELAEKVAKEGKNALVGDAALSSFKESMKDISYKHTLELLKECKVYQHVKENCLNLLKEIDGKSASEIEKRLVSGGMSKEAAQSASKAVKKALEKGKCDSEIGEILEKEITAQITKLICDEMEVPFKKTLTLALKGELKTEAGEKLALAMRKEGIELTEKEIDDLVEAGWKGCQEGVEKAVREVVQKAIKDAFDEFRKRKTRMRLHGSSTQFDVAAQELEEAAPESPLMEKIEEALTLDSFKIETPGELITETRRRSTLLIDDEGKAVSTEIDTLKIVA